MPCTTILIGKNASYDGSTIVARNEDSRNGEFTPKRFAIVRPEEQPRHYRSTISHLEIDLPQNPMRYSSLPNALPDEGVWAAAGVNEANVAMSATETITSNERVLAADPLVPYQTAVGKPGDSNHTPERIGGIGEEDMVTLVLPYVHTAREGVHRLGVLLERYGTYEMNGIAIHDSDEIWWLETIGGHHWMARRVPDDCYVTMPNQLGIDRFDFADAEGAGIEHLCSAGLRSFVREHRLDLAIRHAWEGDDVIDPRSTFGSSSDADHVYNTPRAWAIQRHLNPSEDRWDGPDATYGPESDNIPWCRKPERKLTIEDVKYVLSLHYQGTPYDPYGPAGSPDLRGQYRPIGINRTSQLSATQLRGDQPKNLRAIQWVAFGSNPFNAFVPVFAQVDEAPAYLSNTGRTVSTESFYWTSRLIGALADAHYGNCIAHIERYQESVGAQARALLIEAERGHMTPAEANANIVAMVRTETELALDHVLFEASMGMRNGFARSDN